jgi:hypothetical protein
LLKGSLGNYWFLENTRRRRSYLSALPRYLVIRASRLCFLTTYAPPDQVGVGFFLETFFLFPDFGGSFLGFFWFPSRCPFKTTPQLAAGMLHRDPAQDPYRSHVPLEINSSFHLHLYHQVHHQLRQPQVTHRCLMWKWMLPVGPPSPLVWLPTQLPRPFHHLIC